MSHRYDLDRTSGDDNQRVLVRHSCSIEVLAWGEAILAAGPDCKVPDYIKLKFPRRHA